MKEVEEQFVFNLLHSNRNEFLNVKNCSIKLGSLLMGLKENNVFDKSNCGLRGCTE